MKQNITKLACRGLSLALCLGMTFALLAGNVAYAASSTITFQEFPAIEDVIAANGVDETYGPNTKDGYVKNKFIGYYQTTVEAEGKSAILYSYTPESCIISNPVVLAVLDEGDDVAAFFNANSKDADKNGFGILALAASDGGWGQDGPALITAATALITPSKEIYNYYSSSNRTLVGYGKGAAAAMTYLENDKNASSYSSAALYQPKGYTYSEVHANSEYVCPLKLVSSSYDGQQKSFVELFRKNNENKNVTVVESAVNGRVLPLELVGAYQRVGTTVRETLPVCDKSDPNYRGLSLRTVMADGILRYYYIYIPKAVRNSSENVPVVLAMHGKSARYTDFVYNSGWLSIADDENIIVAFPLASPDVSVSVNGVYTALAWGRWDDTNFIQNYLVADILSKDNADPSRVYAFGHSSGCCMAIAQAVSSGDNGNPFAAVTGTGGWLGYWEPLGFATEDETFDTKGNLFVPKDDEGDGVYTIYEKNDRFDDTLQIPTQILYGENDTVMTWAMGTPNAQPGGPGFVNLGVFRMFQFYREHYGFGKSMNDMMRNATIYRDGDFSNYVFYNQDNVPVLHYAIVKGLGHGQNEAEARQAYEYFKDFHLDSEGNIIYTGTSDDNGITSELLPLDTFGWFAGGKDWASYKDVAPSDWFQAGVKYVSENNVMSGTSDTSFAPNTAISRADAVLSLWHLAGEPSVCVALPYENVETDAYRAAILWAVKMGIIGTDGSTTFDHDGTVTREEFALMLYRCAGSPETKGTLEAFSDGGKVSSSAQKALQWAVEKGIIVGKSAGFLESSSVTSRAEAATMLERYGKIK